MIQLLNRLFKMWFKKKTPKKWEFGDKPIVKWCATNKTSYDMETVCKLILTQIFNINDISLIISTNDKLVKRFDKDNIEMQAILQGYPDIKQYCLYLRSTATDLLTIICHEMIHLSQYYRGDLRVVGTTFKWKGQDYNKIPYNDRPWEKEAFGNQSKIEKQVKKLYYE